MSRGELSALRRLATALGVLTEYVDQEGNKRSASPETLVEVIRHLGEPIEGPGGAAEALRRLQEARAERLIEPTIVDWTGVRSSVPLGPAAARSRLTCILVLESGEERSWRQAAGPSLALPPDLPIGRHRLTVRTSGAGTRAREASAVVLTAPPRVGPAHLIPGAARTMGTFLPLYALRTRRDWGVGDLTDLGALAAWSRARGAPIVGTLPLLAAYLDRPLDYSPYAPVSRLFYNELYLDVEHAPDLEISPAAREILRAPGLQREIAELRAAPLVDYARAMALKRRILGALAEAALATPRRRREVERFARERPLVREYAAFRAAIEKQGRTWESWPERMQRGRLGPADVDRSVRWYHLYCQCLLHDQLSRLAERLHDEGGALYLDLPVGVHGGGFDTWRFGSLFVSGMSVGAPPDPMAPGGQNWGFPPLHPIRSREDGHEYFALALRAHLRYARLLRIDHVMWFHRLFWVPRSLDPAHGAYVRYPAEELYAVLSIEAHRAGARVVGENLGTVPLEVNAAMARRGVLGMSIAQFEFRADERSPLPESPADALAALNTHDLPPFAAFITGEDQRLRAEMGLTTPRAAAREQTTRRRLLTALVKFARRAGIRDEEPVRAALRAALSLLASGPAAIVLVNLEDLWLETRPQNVPGTTDQQAPNWRRRAAFALEEFERLPGVAELLRGLAELRARPVAMAAGGVRPTPERGAHSRTPVGRSRRGRRSTGYVA